jgi:SSS family transporter
MHLLDWAVVLGYFVWIVWDGVRRSHRTDEVEGYFLANRSLPWWAVGLSVMATQLSAITLVGTTGRGFGEGMSVIQLYFGLPLAMIILSVTVVPFFYRARVYTAYEYLEQRFDVKTRTLTSLLFLLSRGLACGAVLSAPSVILSVIFGWNLPLTVLAMGVPAVGYTLIGGVQAVTWADVKQMFVIVAGVAAAVTVVIVGLPADLSVSSALHLAGSTGRLTAIDFDPSLAKTYTFWSGLIGGLFLMLSYFGCDQSQVQRFLTARSIDEGRHSLLMSAFAKIPLQIVIPLIGVLMFAYYVHAPAPLLFNGVHDTRVRASARAADYAAVERQYEEASSARRAAANAYTAARAQGAEAAMASARADFASHDAEVSRSRAAATRIVRDVTRDQGFGDTNYVFPTFVTTRMPIGLVGLIIAAIFAASMSTVAAELNSLATATVIDFYKRLFVREATDAHYLAVAKVATAGWGLFACVVALFAAGLGPLIDVVNRFGSFFYGSILGVFILAMFVRRATGHGAFVGLIAGIAAVAAVATWLPWIAFLWHNVVGVVAVVIVGTAVSVIVGGQRARRDAAAN